ncbi:MAG: hypothetical protein AAF742_08310 [Pseudomonadota bacterium]
MAKLGSICLLITFSAAPATAELDRSDLFGLLDGDGDFNIERAEELFGELEPVSGVVTIGGFLIPSNGSSFEELFATAAKRIGSNPHFDTTFQTGGYENKELRHARFVCPQSITGACVFSRQQMYSVERDEYRRFASTGKRKMYSTWEYEGATFSPGYAPKQGKLGLLFVLDFLENGEPFTLEVMEVLPVEEGLAQSLRELFLQDQRPATKQNLVFRYHFQAAYVEPM